MANNENLDKIMKTEKVTILVTSYNVENYINECLDSLLSQTYENIEVILVDDGSSDTTAEIIQEYEMRDSRIRFYQQRNGGISCARNEALSHVTGDYISIIDSDDYVSRDYVEKALERMNLTGADGVINELYYLSGVNLTKHIIRGIDTENEIISGKRALKESIDWNVHAIGLWKKHVFSSLLFDTSGAHGNEYTNHVILSRADKIAFARGRYYYRKNEQSITNKISVKRFDFAIKNMKLRNLLMANGVYSDVAEKFEHIQLNWLKHLTYYFIQHNDSFSKKEKTYAFDLIKKQFKELKKENLRGIYKRKGTLNYLFFEFKLSNFFLYYVISRVLVHIEMSE